MQFRSAALNMFAQFICGDSPLPFPYRSSSNLTAIVLISHSERSWNTFRRCGRCFPEQKLRIKDWHPTTIARVKRTTLNASVCWLLHMTRLPPPRRKSSFKIVPTNTHLSAEVPLLSRTPHLYIHIHMTTRPGHSHVQTLAGTATTDLHHRL